jgi:hypothetical protein
MPKFRAKETFGVGLYGRDYSFVKGQVVTLPPGTHELKGVGGLLEPVEESKPKAPEYDEPGYDDPKVQDVPEPEPVESKAVRREDYEDKARRPRARENS